MGIAFWRTPRWRGIFAIDDDLAEAEGLAAGTGLLTGSFAGRDVVTHTRCPRCSGPGAPEVEAVDLVGSTVALRCPGCGHAWHAPKPARAS